MRAAYTDLFEFAHSFNLDELGDELHQHLSEDLYPAEAAIIALFRREMVTYQGSELIRWFPAELVDAQFALTISVNGHSIDRIRRGSPEDLFGEKDIPCHDCAAIKGQLHAWGLRFRGVPELPRAATFLRLRMGVGVRRSDRGLPTNDWDPAIVWLTARTFGVTESFPDGAREPNVGADAYSIRLSGTLNRFALPDGCLEDRTLSRSLESDSDR